jgi:DNA-directed RNA polymerase subunit M/transcription elongation factor TFIIS
MAETIPGSRPRTTCAQCGGSDVITIEMTLPEGTQVIFCSCHTCENRWWDRDGEALELDAVLRLAKPAT